MTATRNGPIDPARMERLRGIAGEGPVLILTHNNPDPDALASGKALSILFKEAWGIPSHLVYSGMVARAENQVMLRRLTPEWEYYEKLPDLRQYSAVAQVDTQPGAGNNGLDTVQPAHIIIDHHNPVQRNSDGATYSDIRTDIGATVTMLCQYFEALRVRPDPRLATAMFYGLKTDTRSLSRGASAYDDAAFVSLLHSLDQHELSRIELAGLSREYFRAFSRGLHATRIFGEVIVSRLGMIEQPDFAAEIADILIRLHDVNAVLCLGQHRDTLQMSLRTEPKVKPAAGMLIQQVVVPPGTAGGRRTMAGGQIPLDGLELEQLCSCLERRFLDVMGETGEGVELLDEDS